MEARQYHHQMVHFLRKRVTFETPDGAVVGKLPAGALVLLNASGLHVGTVFNAGTTNTIDIGVEGNNDLFATALAAGTVGTKVLDENIAALLVAEDTVVTVEYNQTGTAATAGSGVVFIAYIPDTDG